jgi:hypothetical protein
MVTPINLQLAHWNLEHTAQQNRDPSAMAAQAARQGEGIAAAEQRDTTVQAADSSAEQERLGRKKEREENNQGRKRRGKRKKEESETHEGDKGAHPAFPSGTGKFDLYA